MQHLWEIKHPYYCSETNYFSNDCTLHFSSWADFLMEFGNADKDFNFLFRWDWNTFEDEVWEGEEHHVWPWLKPYEGEDDEQTDILHLCFMQQRKGKYVHVMMPVRRSEEGFIRSYLTGYWEHMNKVWEGVAPQRQDSAV